MTQKEFQEIMQAFNEIDQRELTIEQLLSYEVDVHNAYVDVREVLGGRNRP